MNREPLTMFCYADISGQLARQGVPHPLSGEAVEERRRLDPDQHHVHAARPDRAVAMGPLRRCADDACPRRRGQCRFRRRASEEHFFLCDILETDGTPWDCCPRTLLRNAAADLRRETGIVMRVAYEHEFVYSGGNGRDGHMYALDAVRRHGNFGEVSRRSTSAASRPTAISPSSRMTSSR